MQSTYGLSIASSTRSVGRVSCAWWTEATTQSSRARSSSGTSTSPLVRMFASTPARILQLRIPRAHLLDLLELRGHAAVAEIVGVVGDRVVRVAARDRRLDHLLQRALPVRGPVRVRVQVAAHLSELDELRQLPAPRRLELAVVLAQLRRDRLIAEELVQRVLVLRAEDVAGLDGGDAVLGDGQPAPHRVLAHRHVVLLRAGEVLQQVPVRLRRDDAQVEAKPLGGDDGRLRVAVRRDVQHPRQAR